MSTEGLDELARRVKQGDRAALGELHAALQPRLAGVLQRYRHLGAEGPLEPADLAQQAFLIVADLARSWPGQGPFIAWVVRLFPLALLAYRREMLRWDGPEVLSLGADDLALLCEEHADPAPGPDPAEYAFCRQLLAQLPAQRQQLLWWRFGDGLSYGDIERLHGLPAGSAQRLCEQSLSYLRALARGDKPRHLRPAASLEQVTKRR